MNKKSASLYSTELKDLIARLLTVDPAKRLSADEALRHPWFRDTPPYMSDLFTEKERSIFMQDYKRLYGEQAEEASEFLTEHPLETIDQDDLPPEERNYHEKSYILAPYNSIMNLDDTQEDITLMAQFEHCAIKFLKNVRDVNRNYEQNNNADLDNGVICDVIQEHVA